MYLVRFGEMHKLRLISWALNSCMTPLVIDGSIGLVKSNAIGVIIEEILNSILCKTIVMA